MQYDCHEHPVTLLHAFAPAASSALQIWFCWQLSRHAVIVSYSPPLVALLGRSMATQLPQISFSSPICVLQPASMPHSPSEYAQLLQPSLLLLLLVPVVVVDMPLHPLHHMHPPPVVVFAAAQPALPLAVKHGDVVAWQ